MIDRGLIKWQPFNSCFSSQTIANDLKKEKEKIKLPILSDEQISIIEEKIFEAFNLKMTIRIDYFYDGRIISELGKIYNIKIPEKKICFNNKNIYVKQIIKITF